MGVKGGWGSFLGGGVVVRSSGSYSRYFNFGDSDGKACIEL